jgi:hypothetical protein
MQAHLLDGVGDVGPGEGEVLGCVGETHASPLQDVDGILALMEEETLRPALGGDTEKVVEGPRSFIVDSR